jgi:hypothetical protein
MKETEKKRREKKHKKELKEKENRYKCVIFGLIAMVITISFKLLKK